MQPQTGSVRAIQPDQRIAHYAILRSRGLRQTRAAAHQPKTVVLTQRMQLPALQLPACQCWAHEHHALYEGCSSLLAV